MVSVMVGSVPVMAIGDQDQVRAAALMHYESATGAATAILLVQFRPHAIAPAGWVLRCRFHMGLHPFSR